MSQRSAKEFEKQVKRNPGRFPGDFVFALTRAERDEVVANCDHLQRYSTARWRAGAITFW